MGIPIRKLRDNFTVKDQFKWRHSATGGDWQAYETNTSSRLNLTTRTDYAAHLVTVDAFDLTEDSLPITIVTRPSQATDFSTEAYYFLRLDSSNEMSFLLNGSGGWLVNIKNAGVDTGTFGTYVAATLARFRFRHHNGVIYFESARAGGDTWVQLFSAPVTFAVTDLYVHLETGVYGTVASPGTFQVDDVNLVQAKSDLLNVDTGQASARTCTITTTAKYNPNTLILVAVAIRNGTATLSDYTVTDDQGGTYVLDSSTVTAGSTQGGVFIFRRTEFVTGAGWASGVVITATGPSSVNKIAAAVHSIELATDTLERQAVSPASGGNAGSSTAVTVSLGTPAELWSTMLMAACLYYDGSDTWTTAGSGTTNALKGADIATTGGTTNLNCRLITSFKNNTVITANAITDTLSTARAWRAASVQYKTNKPEDGSQKQFFAAAMG